MFATRAEAFMAQQKHQWLQAGMQTGELKGELKGQQKLQTLLIKTLKKRFDQTPESALSMIQSADLERLDFLMDCALDADSLDDWLLRVRH